MNKNNTLYASPLMVMTEEEYTKHYYIEGERVCSKIGGGFALAKYDPGSTTLGFLQGSPTSTAFHLWEMVLRGVDCSCYDSSYMNIKQTMSSAENDNDDVETNQYFYHSDHLGSASFISDATGYATQHLQYLPYGELFVDQHGAFDSRYKFSAKEKDDETQYSYFGARYYDSDLSVWLSVDPMAGSRSWISPYNYCQWNPVGRVDPSGALDTDYGVTSSGEVRQIGPTNNEPDRLFAINDDGTKKSDAYVTVNDPNILPYLSVDLGTSARVVYKFADKRLNDKYQNNRTYLYEHLRLAESRDEKTMYELFYFLANNTNVEWALNVYKTGQSVAYVLGTKQKYGSAPGLSKLNNKWRYDNLVLDTHNHTNTKYYGASGYSDDGGDYDMLMLAPNVPHFVYDVTTQTMFQYTPKSEATNIKKIFSYLDLIKK